VTHAPFDCHKKKKKKKQNFNSHLKRGKKEQTMKSERRWIWMGLSCLGKKF